MSVYHEILLGKKELLYKFRNLEIYFQDITKEDLHVLDIYDFIGYAKPELKSLMDLFVHQYIVKFLDESPIKIIGEIEFYYFKDSFRLCFKDLQQIYDFDVNFIRNKMKDQSGFITFIDMSDLDIKDKDLSEIYKIVKCLPSLKDCVLKLSNNKIHGIQSYEANTRLIIKGLLEDENLSYVDIRNNPFCSIDSACFFDELASLCYRKLIFRSQFAPESCFFFSVDSSTISLIHQIHQNYYELVAQRILHQEVKTKNY